jgi:protease-4
VRSILIILVGLFILLVAFSAIVTLIVKDGVSLKDKIALVTIEGPILDAKGTVEEIKGYVDDESIKAIVIRVNSPGGAVAPSQEIFSEVRRAVSNKKVVVSMGALAASGGYYVSAPADRIVANPGTITGSIGVIMEIPNIENLMNKVGIKTYVIKSGKHKDLASVFRELGEEERQILQGVIDDVYDQFIEDVAETRDISVQEVRKLADGRIFSGRQAVELGLVDELGGLEDAIRVTAKLAGIKGEPEVVTKEEKLSFIKKLLKSNLTDNFGDIFPQIRLNYMYSP